MSFYGRSFIYDNTPSDIYGIFIADLDGSAINNSMGSAPLTIREEYIFNKSTPYFYGASHQQRLSFKMKIFSEKEITADEFQQIQKWLFSSRNYKKLQIVQEDMQDVYFNAILNSPEVIRVGNIIQGFSFIVECDSPFAYRFPKTTSYIYSSENVLSTEVFYNSSDDKYGYLYPSLVITMNSLDGYISITNDSDDPDRIFQFNGLSANEVLTVDCEKQIITSSTGLKRLSNFSKNFLRLISGVNVLQIEGNVHKVEMTTRFIVKKVSG